MNASEPEETSLQLIKRNVGEAEMKVSSTSAAISDYNGWKWMPANENADICRRDNCGCFLFAAQADLIKHVSVVPERKAE